MPHNRVRIHFNLRVANFALSKDFHRVASYLDKVCLRDCKFIVSNATRDRVRRMHRRKVYAWVEGTLCDCHDREGLDVTINPYRDDAFVVRGTSREVHTASHVAMWLSGTRPEMRAKVLS